MPKVDRQSLKGFIRVIQNNFFMLKYVFKYTPLYAILHIIVQILFGFFDVMWGILIMKFVIDAVTVEKSFELVLLAAGILLVYGSTIQIIAAYMYEIYAPIKIEKLNKAVNDKLYEKVTKLDYSCYSNPKFYNDFVWAASQAEGKANESLNLLADICKSLVTISGIVAVIASLDKIGLIFAGISTIASFVFRIIQNKIGLKQEEDKKPHERKRDYVNRVFYLPDYAKEMRMSKLKENLIDDYVESNKNLKGIIKKYYRKFTILHMLSQFVFVSFLLEGVFLFIISYRAIIMNVISSGDFVALAEGSWTLKWSLENFVNAISGMQEKSIYIEKLRYFLGYENKLVDKPDAMMLPSHMGSLSLKNICFTYEGSEVPVLSEISMEIKHGEKIAIVGYNGAGKSTLIKLISRLYDVTDGEIQYDGHNIKDYKLAEYYKSFGTVFQDYQLFAGTLLENVLMDTQTKEIQKETAEQALEKSGFSEKLHSLEKGLDSDMTKEFHDDGVNLSGGETQKIAISRIFANTNARILILDEPSSALDPIAEYNLNKSMLDAAEDKTVIFISHRLSTTKIADRIYMMENGRIIEAGNHEELMKLNGKYCEMFNLQTSNYSLAEYAMEVLNM